MSEDKTNFFETVANQNLERFHSETISWLFNTFQDAAIEFILKIHPAKNIIKDEIQFIKSEAEKEQIDIKLQYKIGETEHYIFIENKLKATEHEISRDKLSKYLKKNLKATEFSAEVKASVEALPAALSQTEYYYFRETSKHPRDRCHFIYLIPNRVNENEILITNMKPEIEANGFDFMQLNQWNIKTMIKNPWVTITYAELAYLIKSGDLYKTSSEQNKIIATGYINYILGENFSEFIDLANFNNNKFGQFNYFKLLLALVKSKLEDKNILYSVTKNEKENPLYEYINAGSSNGGMPLFAFYKKIETNKNFTYFSNLKDELIDTPTINIGIQVQGDNFKYYVSADHHNYDQTKVKKIIKNTYGDFVKKVLTKITEEFKADFNDLKNDGFNPNKNKTFYSRSYKIAGFIETKGETRNIFKIAEEISEKVNAFIHFRIKNIY